MCFFVNGYRNRRDLRVLTEHMVHMEHMAVVSDSQLRLAEQPLNLKLGYSFISLSQLR